MSHVQLEKEASLLRPGQSGLLALDWLNGNRTILGDQLLSGLVLGLSLQTTAVELYQALIEAAGFGARIIHSHLEKHGIPVEEIIMCGGIPSKNAHLMQTYADIFRKPLRVAGSHYTSALGGAIVAAVCAGIHPSIEEAIKVMTSLSEVVYFPREKEPIIYDRLFNLYKNLHDCFGRPGHSLDMYPVMKELLQIKEETRAIYNLKSPHYYSIQPRPFQTNAIPFSHLSEGHAQRLHRSLFAVWSEP
jgi:L-ribulokinase